VLVLALVALARPASPGEVPRVGLLWLDGPAAVRPYHEAFLRGLYEHGYVVGQNVLVEQRWADGYPNRLPGLARELARLRVAVIVTGSLASVRAAQQATRAIPIVFATLSDPRGAGLVGRVGHLAVNATGLTIANEKLAGHRVELLKEAYPQLRDAAILWNSANRGVTPILRETEEAARRTGLALRVCDVRRARDLEAVFQTFQHQPPGALIVLPDPLFGTLHARILELTARAGLPAMFARREFAEGGGLMSYGPSYAELFQRSAGFVDRILRGASATELPIERPTTFELVVNAKTARALGIALPDALLLRAEQIR
jgi:putative ABC transport system substrate-binding protein